MGGVLIHDHGLTVLDLGLGGRMLWVPKTAGCRRACAAAEGSGPDRKIRGGHPAQVS
jgi:hypothetical protein